MPIKNTSIHPYLQVGEEIIINISKEKAVVLSSKRVANAWQHKIMMVPSSPEINSTYKFFGNAYVYKEDYPKKQGPFIREFSEKSLNKVFIPSTMSFKQLISYCNGGCYG